MTEPTTDNTNELLKGLPPLTANRNGVDATLTPVLGKKRGWEGLPYYKLDTKTLPVEKLVAWAGEDFVRKTIGQRLTLIFQEAMWRASNRLTGKKIKNEKGEEEDEYEPTKFDQESFLKAVTELRQASGKTIKELQSDLDDALEDFAAVGAEVEAAQKAGDAQGLMKSMAELVQVSKDITSIQAALKDRRRPKSEE